MTFLALSVGALGADAQPHKSPAAPQQPAAQIPSAEEALRARHEGRLPAFGQSVDEMLRQQLLQKPLNQDAIVPLSAWHVFANRFATAKLSADESKTLDWLVRHPTLGPLLLNALSERDNAARVTAVLAALRGKYEKSLEQFPDLAVATCVVWDTPAREGQTPEQATQAACDVFGHLTQNRKSLRMDPQALPWPVLIYLVDSHVSPEERQWALQSYRLPPDPGAAYFQVRYDMEAFNSGQWRGGQQPYTLANLQRLGGVCKDEAYFASEVCRAYGIPATVCTGQSGMGEGFHAWVGILRKSPSKVAWDFETARYSEHGFWSGTVIDPQTGQKLTDGEAAIGAQWCTAAPARRLFSTALTQSIDLAQQPERIPLCKAAIEAAPGNLQAWTLLVDECAKPQTPFTHVQDVAAVIERFAVRRYDDFAYKSFVSLLATVKPDDQMPILDRMARLFPDRPDLLADLALRKGDLLQKLSRPVDALQIYLQVLKLSVQYGPISLEAMARVDALLRPAGKLRDLTEHYRITWTQMNMPDPSGYAWTTPWYIMGERYAKLLEETGNEIAAKNVRAVIYKHDLSHHEREAK